MTNVTLESSRGWKPAGQACDHQQTMRTPVPQVLAVCEFGDPMSPRSWSGTPHNVCTVLQRMGALAGCVNADVPFNRLAMKAVKAISMAYYAGSYQHPRGRVFRHVRARYVQHQMKAVHQDVLHFGAGHLPLFQPQGDRRHYLYLDTTFHRWSRLSTQAGRWKPRLVRDANDAEGRAYRQMTHIFTIGEYVRGDLVEHYGVDPARITPVGTGRGFIEPFTGEKDYTEPTILFVAKARFEDKGGDLVVEAFKLARKRVPNLKLVIVGQDSYRQMLGEVEGMTVHGHVSKEELQSLFNRATLFAMPSRNEPWGLVYLEAMACRMPVVGLNRNSIPELTNHGKHGFRVDEPTPAAVADAFIDACSDPARLKQMGEEAQRFVLERYTWEKVAQRMLEVIGRMGK